MCVKYHVAPHEGDMAVFASVTYPVGHPPAYMRIAGTTYVQVMQCQYEGKCSLCGYEGGHPRFCPGCGAEIRSSDD